MEKIILKSLFNTMFFIIALIAFKMIILDSVIRQETTREFSPYIKVKIESNVTTKNR